MKPKVLLNEKYRAEIEALYEIKNSMNVFDRIAIESMKYDLDVNRPLQQYDFAYLRVMQKRYNYHG